ncbi:MAG: hypothetical protein J0L75_21270, partial [Spirochaetes bacterium]|nr:hypothetical protein [Spirochaetota bacterium]
MKPASLLAAVLLLAFLPLSAEDKKPDGGKVDEAIKAEFDAARKKFEEAKGEFEKVNEKMKAARGENPEGQRRPDMN